MRFCLDRVEGNIAVCYTDPMQKGDAPYEFSLDAAPALRGLADGTLFEATLSEDGRLCDVAVLAEQTEARRQRNAARLKALFERGRGGR